MTRLRASLTTSPAGEVSASTQSGLVSAALARPTPGIATRAQGDEHGHLLSEIVRSCAELLATAGPLAMLALLNSRTRFRFTGIYHADPPDLQNLFLYDRENPTLNVSGDVSRLDETFCSIVCDEHRPFATSDASRDDRLSSHAARERVLSYCGVPIRRESGVIWGTLCHYDVRPRLLPCSETEILEQIAWMIGCDPTIASS